MSPVWMLVLFQSVILRLTETESTSRVGSLAHFHTLNHQNHQNQLWRFADVIESLHKCNIPIPIVKWVHSFIQDRQATISLDGRWDRLKPVSTGIPQGSCTSPILVAYFTAPMCEAISKGAREKIKRDPELSTLMHTGKASHAPLTLYVDDGSIAASAHNCNTSTKIIELALQAAHNWLTTQGLKADQVKNKLIHFTKSNCSRHSGEGPSVLIP